MPRTFSCVILPPLDPAARACACLGGMGVARVDVCASFPESFFNFFMVYSGETPSTCLARQSFPLSGEKMAYLHSLVSGKHVVQTR